MDRETQVRLEKGREHYENNEFDRAEPYLRKVAEAEDGYADVNNMLGVIYHSKGQLAKAQEYLEKALESNPRYTEAALNLAVVYAERGLYAKAKKIHEHITSLKPTKETEIEQYACGKLANMHAETARAYADLGLVEESVAEYQKALKLCPEFVDLRTRMGQVLKNAGKLDDAVKEFQTVKQSRPSYVPARISLGVTYFAKKDTDAAKKEWEEVLKVDQENRAAKMYVRMVETLENASSNASSTTPPADAKNDLEFSYNGEKSSVAPATVPDEDKE